MKYYLIFLLGLLLGSTNICRASEASLPDSLLIRFEQNPGDEELCSQLCLLIREELFNDPEAAAGNARKIMKIAEENGRRDMQAQMILNLGIAYDLKGQYDSALLKFEEALILAREHELKTIEGDIYNNYGIVYAYRGQLGKSLDYGIKALEIFEILGDSVRLAKIYNNLGSRYSEMNLEQTALEYYQKAIDINTRTGDNYRLSHNYGNIGTIYSEMGENHKALEYYNKAYELQKDLANQRDLSITLGNLAVIYQNMEDYDRSMEFAHQSYEIALQTNDEIGKLTYFTTCGKTFLKQKNYNKSLECFLQAKKLAEKMGARQSLIEIYKGLSELFAEKDNFKTAFFYNEKYLDERFYLHDSERNKALNMLKDYENIKKENEIALLTKDTEIQKLNLKRQKILRNSISGLGIVVLLFAIGVGHRYIYMRRTRNELADKNLLIINEKQKSDRLLLNILPEETAVELMENGSSKARKFELATVLFSDFKGFTKVAEQLSPEELVAEVDHCFIAFDNIISKYNIEKIKTIGDAYMCAGGLPVANTTSPWDVAGAALEILEFMEEYKQEQLSKGKPYFEIRIGIHSGPVVAGIVGNKKFAYDIWGDTVNIASRMESSGEAGRINVSGTTYTYIKEDFECEYRGKIEAKNKGLVDMYFVKGRKEVAT
ncbi:MAG: adenylate/guanylate cyclase domain-containing protein [Bacteroidales bacterium]